MAKRPVDIRRLRPTQLLRLLNSTALGPVMTRSQLRRQMDAAALRVGDGETVHLVRYTRWLVREYLRPPEVREVGACLPAGGRQGYAAALERARARGSTELAEVRRADTRAGHDIAPVRDVEDWDCRVAGARGRSLADTRS